MNPLDDPAGNGAINREIAGALASFWSGGDGPSHSAVDTAFELADVDVSMIPLGNKEDRVRAALRLTDTYVGEVRLVEELLDVLRARGAFEDQANKSKLGRLQRAFARTGSRLDEHGFLDWGSPYGEELSQPEPDISTSQSLQVASAPPVVPVEVPEPSRELLIRLLRRIPTAFRPLIERRRARQGIALVDEYDLQDVVEATLRLLYNDVRPEERSPSNAGSSSTIDFLVKQEQLAIEIKVTRQQRGEKDIKNEITTDIFDYERHPSVRGLLIVIYDLAGTFKNAGGFEDDFTKYVNNLQVETLVVGSPVTA